jgi:Domain of unknown function (DUF5134)
VFTFAATPVKFVGLIVLFAWCTVWCVYELTRPVDWRRRLSNVLHLLMSVAMLAMVWTGVWMPLASVIGLPAIVAVFALATGWFLWRAVEARGSGRTGLAHAAGHAVMFAAMTWHLSAMAIKRGAMSGMAGQAGGAAVTLAVVGVPFMVYLLVAGLNDVRRALLPRAAASVCHCGTDCTCGPDCACGASVPASEEVREHEAELSGPGYAASRQLKLIVAAPAASGCHEARRVGTPAYRLSALSDAAMNLGMFWMSTGLLVAIAPFMRMLSF